MRWLLALLLLVLVPFGRADKLKLQPASLDCTGSEVVFDFASLAVLDQVGIDGNGYDRAGLTAYVDTLLELSQFETKTFAPSSDIPYLECSITPEIWCVGKWCYVVAWEFRLQDVNGMLLSPLSNDRVKIYVEDHAAIGESSIDSLTAIESDLLLAEGRSFCVKRGDRKGVEGVFRLYFVLEMKLSDGFKNSYSSSIYPTYRVETFPASLPDIPIFCEPLLNGL